MRPNVALDTMLLGLPREAVDEQEGGRRKKRGKWAAAPTVQVLAEHTHAGNLPSVAVSAL